MFLQIRLTVCLSKVSFNIFKSITWDSMPICFTINFKILSSATSSSDCLSQILSSTTSSSDCLSQILFPLLQIELKKKLPYITSHTFLQNSTVKSVHLIIPHVSENYLPSYLLFLEINSTIMQ